MYEDAVKAGGYAVVTGAASGIGRAAARRFAEDGLGVVLADMPGPQLEKAVSKVRDAAKDGAGIIGKATDVTSDADMEALAETAFSAGPVAILMNNAGVGGPKTTAWGHRENWNRILDVNLHGVKSPRQPGPANRLSIT